MDWLEFPKRLVPKVKPVTIIVAVAASVMLTFGDVLWSAGLALLVLALGVRVAVPIIAKSTADRLETVESKVEAPEKYISPGRPSDMFISDEARIKVIGLGGAGCNAVTRMVAQGIQGVKFIAMNTDAKALALCKAPFRMQFGKKLTKGLGAGGDYDIGQKAAKESRDEIKGIVSGADVVFITAGLGGGTGTGAAPVVAEIAKQSGALTIAVVTRPFSFEGIHRMQVADEGMVRLLGIVDALIIIANDRLLAICDQKTPVDSVFKLADDVLSQGIRAIAEVITVPGLVNLDLADIKGIMKDAGPGWMAIGEGSGRNRAVDAAKAALASALLDVSTEGSTAVLFNVVGGSDLTLYEVNEAAQVVKQAVHPEANILFGVFHDPDLGDKVRITIITTGFISKLEMAADDKEAEIAKLLKGLETEELDIDSFLRRCRAKNN